jgi:glutamate formiminotransferase/formiminotetrahydrofolate cyclodeaminase
LLALVDADTEAFNAIMAALGMPRESDEEALARMEAIQAATRRAIEVPLAVMEASLASMEVIGAMAEAGIPASVSDAGVGAMCARTAALGAFLNVRINAQSLRDEAEAADYIERGRRLQEQAIAREEEILAQVEQRI